MKLRAQPYLCLSPEKGAVIIVALWAVVILAIIGLAISSLVSPQIKLAQSVTEKSATIAAVNAALKFAYEERKKDRDPEENPDFNYDSLFELSQKKELILGNVLLSYQLSDENRKINFNSASKDVLKRLPGLNDDNIIDNIIAYRNNKFFSLNEELLLVEGMSQEIFGQSEDSTTVFGDGRVNINTAPDSILMTLGLSDDLVSLIMRYRKGDDNEEATEDDNVFKEIANIISDLNNFRSLSDEQEAALQDFIDQNLFSTSSNIYLMELETSYLNRPAYKFRIIIDAISKKVLLWQENV